MTVYRADLHIHSVLSPCGDLEMSPVNIIEQAKAKKIDIIGITDHNSTRQCQVIKKLGEEQGILVLCGAEVTTKEEVHCLAFFEKDEELALFQEFLDAHLPNIPNKPNLFGYQVSVNRNEEIQFEEERLLISALDVGIDQVAEKIRMHNGLFIPAHIDKPSNSLFSQLGFIPPQLKADAFEFTGKQSRKQMEMLGLPKNATLITSSDAHLPEDIGKRFTQFHMEHLCFQGIQQALQNQTIENCIE
ncbi:PHP domain-containing protein [Prolixibacteraceae bacterium JC049]|nr:PHP domain-containing protein [Prolixibacteraceae bacterium JC049]